MSGGQSQDRKISEQDILKIFDEADAPVLTSSEIAEELPVSRQAVNYRLEQMLEKELVGKKKTGARSVAWWAKVAPGLSARAVEDVERAREQIDRGETVALEDI